MFDLKVNNFTVTAAKNKIKFQVKNLKKIKILFSFCLKSTLLVLLSKDLTLIQQTKSH
jgi:hypothetical protein